MSAISDAARVTLVIADYAVFDQAGKLNVVGGGWQITPAIMTPNGAALPDHRVAALIEIPQNHAGEEVALTLTLRTASEEPVLLPAPEGQDPQPLRIAQLAVVQKPQVPGIFIPTDVPCRIGMATGLPAGLPLAVSESYHWTLHIDDETKPEWRAGFYFVGPPPNPVIG